MSVKNQNNSGLAGEKDKKTASRMQVKRGIRTKLLMGFSALLVLTIVIGYTGYYGVTKVFASVENLGGKRLGMANTITDLVQNMEDIRRYLLAGYLGRGDAKTVGNNLNEYNKYKAELEKNITHYETYVTTDEHHNLVNVFKKSNVAAATDTDQIWKAIQTGKGEEIGLLVTDKSKESFNQCLVDLQALQDYLKRASAKDVALAQTTHSQIVFLIVGVLIFSILIGVVIALWLARHISKPLIAVTRVTQAVAEGNLGIDLPRVSNQDEIGVLAGAIAQMVDSLRQVIGQVLEQAADVAAATEEISTGTEQAAAGAQLQAKETQAITERISEMAAAAEEMAANAEQAAEYSEKTLTNGEQGQHVVMASVTGMHNVQASIQELGARSEQIGDIVNVIDDIAEQTNLLALNAAIEAARAGEHGKGFAVVADEIRKLAERSGKATKEISKLIAGIQRETNKAVEASQAGAKSSAQAGEVFGDIVNLVRETVNMVEQIAVASTSVADLATKSIGAVQSVAAVTEEFAASSEETAASATSLAVMSENLRQAVSRFQL
ncbi:MAG: methyl-accepting chemotaxis protein [Desulfitobacteriaceae bacterium]